MCILMYNGNFNHFYFDVLIIFIVFITKFKKNQRKLKFHFSESYFRQIKLNVCKTPCIFDKINDLRP